MPRSVRIVLGGLAVAWLVGIAIAGFDHHHGVDSGRVPLPIERTESVGFSGATRLVVECATDVTVSVGKDHGGSALPEVTVWGRPVVGRCHPFVLFPLHPGHDPKHPTLGQIAKFVDGATSDVVTLA